MINYSQTLVGKRGWMFFFNALSIKGEIPESQLNILGDFLNLSFPTRMKVLHWSFGFDAWMNIDSDFAK
jgi:hypothetical protein